MFRFGWHSLYRLSPEKIMACIPDEADRQTEGLGLQKSLAGLQNR